MFIGIAELELFVGQLEVQIQYIVSPCDAVSYLYGKDGLRPQLESDKEAGYVPLVPETRPTTRRGVGNSDASSTVLLAVLILITPILSGIPSCTWAALVRSPCIRLI